MEGTQQWQSSCAWFKRIKRNLQYLTEGNSSRTPQFNTPLPIDTLSNESKTIPNRRNGAAFRVSADEWARIDQVQTLKSRHASGEGNETIQNLSNFTSFISSADAPSSSVQQSLTPLRELAEVSLPGSRANVIYPGMTHADESPLSSILLNSRPYRGARLRSLASYSTSEPSNHHIFDDFDSIHSEFRMFSSNMDIQRYETGADPPGLLAADSSDDSWHSCYGNQPGTINRPVAGDIPLRTNKGKINIVPPESASEVMEGLIDPQASIIRVYTSSKASSAKMIARFHGTDVTHPKQADGNTMYETWDRGILLGVGGQGRVYVQRSKSPPIRLRVVKEIPRMTINAGERMIQREVETMLSVRDSELFVQFYGWYESEEIMYIAMEYVPYGDLAQYVEDDCIRAQSQARTIIKQVLEGLHILHQKGICHRDLKPQNILISNISPLSIKLADFGISKDTFGTELRTQSGTRRYMAPELQGFSRRQLNTYTLSVDIRALGVITYELLTMKHPFQDQETTGRSGSSSKRSTTYTGEVNSELLLDFCRGQVELTLDELLSDQERSFIKRILLVDVNLRMSAGEASKHEWIRGMK